MADDLLDDWWVKEDIEEGGFCGYIIDTKGSVEKRKKKQKQTLDDAAVENNDENIVTPKKKKKQKQTLDDAAVENNDENIVNSKKKKKQKHTLDNAAVENDHENIVTSKKKKKQKQTLDNATVENNEENIVISKKKKKQKQTLDDAAVENNEENNVTSKKKKTKKRTLDDVPVDNNSEDETSSKNKKKSKHQVNDTEVCNDTEDIKPVSKKKKKRKKKIIAVEDYQPTFEALRKFFQSELQKTLSAIEIEDIKPDNDDWYLNESEPIKKDNVDNFPLYLKDVVPDWDESCTKLTKKELKASPIMLIITSSAQRAVDLLRYTSSFKGEKCRTVKLFAKHFKVDDQMKHLEENIVHLAVGTPHRILTLLGNGSLKVKHLKYVIVDWSWKDVKMRRIVNMPDVKEDFVLLFQKHLFSQCQNGTLSVGLF